MAKFSRTITFEQSRSFPMPFGKYKGRTLEDIALTMEGLRYLDWAVGEIKDGLVADCLQAFVANEEVAEMIDEALSHQHDTVDAPEWTPRDWSWLPHGKGGKS